MVGLSHAPRIEVVREGALGILFLDNPPRNLLTRSMVSDFAAMVKALEADEEARAVIVCGAGEADFSGGLDMDEWSRLTAKEAQEAIQRGQDALWALEHMSKPSIAAISGLCRGAGAEVALACDVRIASETAIFSHPEVDAGWMPSHGGVVRLVRILGRSDALEILLSGKGVKAIDALRLGLIDHLVPPGDALDRAKDLARLFAAKPRAAVKAIKRTVSEGEQKPYRNRFLLETQYSVQLLHGEEYKTAMARSSQKK